MSMMKTIRGPWLNERQRETLISAGLLALRVTVASMMLAAHGWGKLITFSDKAAVFPDPLGVGPLASLTLVVFAEVICSLLVIVGFATHLATIPLMTAMLVAAFVIHADDPWQKQEFALLYFFPFLSLLLTGPGRFSLDAFVFRRTEKDLQSPERR